eukprot:scaffold3428_cov379-Prasinococcus_capsulatus_cf.AAC.2
MEWITHRADGADDDATGRARGRDGARGTIFACRTRRGWRSRAAHPSIAPLGPAGAFLHLVTDHVGSPVTCLRLHRKQGDAVPRADDLARVHALVGRLACPEQPRLVLPLRSRSTQHTYVQILVSG